MSIANTSYQSIYTMMIFNLTTQQIVYQGVVQWQKLYGGTANEIN